MKKSKSMIENGNVYSGDDEGFESSPEKVCNKSQQKHRHAVTKFNSAYFV